MGEPKVAAAVFRPRYSKRRLVFNTLRTGAFKLFKCAFPGS